MQKQKGFVQILLLALAVLAVAGIGLYYYLVAKPKTVSPVNTSIAPQYQGSYQQAAVSVTPVNSTADLDKVSSDLTATDTTQIDSGLNSLNTDSSAF